MPITVMHSDPIRRVELALADLRAGRMVILVDDEDRENEGDLVVAAEKVTPEAINFMATHGRGLICVTLTPDQVARLRLPMMAEDNRSPFQTAFTVSIEARSGVTTGISAADRARTIHVAIHASATPADVVTPGHVFPLRARPGGVLERTGQTEGSVDLARLAGLNPSGVICEILNPDGTMARLPDLLRFGATHGLRVCSVADIIQYRLRAERMVERGPESTLTVAGIGPFRSRWYRSSFGGGLHQAIWMGDLDPSPTLVRVQGAPSPSVYLDPGASPRAVASVSALRRIAAERRGALVLLHVHPGEGSLAPSEAAVAVNRARDLGIGCRILVDLGLAEVRLMTRTPRALRSVEAYGLHVVQQLVEGDWAFREDESPSFWPEVH